MAKAQKPGALKATVTYLEATERPRQVTPLPVNIQAALLTVPNIPLHYYRYLHWRIGRQWNWVYRLRMGDEELASIVHDPKTQVSVLMIDGAPSGMFELYRADLGSTNLVYFGLVQNVHGRGLGRWMLGQALLAAWKDPITRLTVSTNTLDHPGALPLYQKMGFSPVSQSEAIVRPLDDEELLAMFKAP